MLDLMQSRTSYLDIFESRFLRIVAPVLQALVAIAIGVLLGFLLLGKMSFVIRCHLPHVRDVVFNVLGRVLLGILLQNLDDLPTTTSLTAIKLHGEYPTSHGRRFPRSAYHGSSQTLWKHRL